MAAVAETIATEAPEANEERVPTFTEAQQALFNKAFRKREAALWRKYIEPMRRDLLDTVGLLQQLFERCTDRLRPEDGAAILDGIAAIRKEYEGGKWQRKP